MNPSQSPEPRVLLAPAWAASISAEKAVFTKLTDMQRDPERAAELDPAVDEEALVLRQKAGSPQDQDDDTQQQWKARQLQRLAQELKAEWQEARLQQVRDLERLYLAHLWDDETRPGSNPDVEGPIHRGTKSTRTKEKHRATFREVKSRREELPRQQAWPPKSRKKTVCSDRRGSTKTRGLNPSEKPKGKRIPSSKSGGGHHSAAPRGYRGSDPSRMNSLLNGAGEIDCAEDTQKEATREGRRQGAKGGSRITQGPNHNLRDQSPQGPPSDSEDPCSPSSTSKQEARAVGSPCKYGDKNQWQKEIESAFEELFNTNRKLKKHLNLHLEQRLKADQNPDETQGSETQGQSSDVPREESVGEAETTSDELGSPGEAEAPETCSKSNVKQLLSEARYPDYQHVAKYPLKRENLMLFSKAGTTVDQEDSFSQSLELGREPYKSSTPVEDAAEPSLPKPEDSIASWLASRQKQKAEMEQQRQKTLFEMTEHPDMSLEIHYKAELEEERRERRRMRLAILKSYPTGIQCPERTVETKTTLDSHLLDEDRQNQMIRDLQQQILEQNRVHKQFLEKARKRLEEFQKTF